MKKTLAIMLSLTLVLTTFSAAYAVHIWTAKDNYWEEPWNKYYDWDFDNGELFLTEEGEEVFAEALEEKRQNPLVPMSMPFAKPLEKPEKLKFSINVKNKNIDYLLADIAGKGDEIKGYITHYGDEWEWYLSLTGKGGNALILYAIGKPMSGGFDHNSTGNILAFPTDNILIYNNRKMNSELRARWKEKFEGTSVYVKGDPKGDGIQNIQIWNPSGDHSGLLYGQEEFVSKPYLSDILKCKIIDYRPPVRYEYFSTSLASLFGVTHDVEKILAQIKEEEEFIAEHAYDHGPKSNYKTPLKWTEVTINREYEWDAYINGTTIVPVPPLMSPMIPSMTGIGTVTGMSIQSIVVTLDGEDWDSYPMVKITGDRGTAWYDIGEFAIGTNSSKDTSNKSALYMKMYRLKDFKDFIKYEDLTRDAEFFELIYHFTDESKEELDHLTLRYKTSVGKTEEINIHASRLTYDGDPKAYFGWWPGNRKKTDMFGEYLDRIGIEWR